MDRRSMVPLPLFLLPSISNMFEPLSPRFGSTLLRSNDGAKIKINAKSHKTTMCGGLRVSEKKLGPEELLERINELLNVLKMISRDLSEVSKSLEAIAVPSAPVVPAASAPAGAEEARGVKDVKTLFSKDLVEMLVFEEKKDHVVIRPRQYLGSDNFSKIASIIREVGGEYISAGKQSHFKIPKEITQGNPFS